MPFKSDAQRRFMYARHPEIAKRWSEEAKHGKTNLEQLSKKTQKKTNYTKAAAKMLNARRK